jgi:uncharacterized protein with HEPN domain
MMSGALVTSFINEYTVNKTMEDFLTDRHMRHAVERNIGIIGEAVSRLRRVEPGTAEQVPQSHQIIGIRNRLAHGYEEEIHNTIIRDAVQRSMPTLHLQVANLIPEFEG